MAISNAIKASIVNESSSNIERLAVKITEFLNSSSDNFIKTFPLVVDPRNLSILYLIKNELPPYKKTSYLGIGLTSYRHVNFIQFISTFTLFPLNKGDKIIFYFENGERMTFHLEHTNQKDGFAYRNVHPITDAEMGMIEQVNLKYWKVTNAEKDISMIGGFTHQEYNKQYKTERTGQKLLRLMAKCILTAKKGLGTLILLATILNPITVDNDMLTYTV